MNNDTITTENFEKFTAILYRALQGMKSLNEIEDWLKSQPCVLSVKTSDYVIKTEPPQKEIFITFRRDNGSTVIKAIDVILHSDQIFSLGRMHDG